MRHSRRASPALAADGGKKVSARALVALGVIALSVVVIDQITKALVVRYLVQGQPAVPIVGDLLSLEFVKNSGAAFSFAAGSTWVFSIVAVGVTIFIVWFSRRIRSLWWAVLFGLLLGGTVGNLADRLFREPGFAQGQVIDFLKIPILPAIFNIADVAIVASMFLFVIVTVRGQQLDGSHVSRHRGAPETDGSTTTPLETEGGSGSSRSVVASASDDKPASAHDPGGARPPGNDPTAPTAAR
jgi:signal peptidase II